MHDDYEFRCKMCKGQWRWKIQFENDTAWACDSHLTETLDAARAGWTGLAPVFTVTARV